MLAQLKIKNTILKIVETSSEKLLLLLTLLLIHNMDEPFYAKKVKKKNIFRFEPNQNLYYSRSDRSTYKLNHSYERSAKILQNLALFKIDAFDRLFSLGRVFSLLSFFVRNGLNQLNRMFIIFQF